MSEALMAEWENRVKEVEKELGVVEAEIKSTQAQRKELKTKIRNYWSEVEEEKKQLLEQFNKLESEIESLRVKCDETVKEKDEVYATYMATLDEYENMHYVVREIRDEEVNLAQREDLEVTLQNESQQWADEEHKLRTQFNNLQHQLKDQRRAHAAQIAQLQEHLVDLEVKQRQAQAEHEMMKKGTKRSQNIKDKLQNINNSSSNKNNTITNNINDVDFKKTKLSKSIESGNQTCTKTSTLPSTQTSHKNNKLVNTRATSHKVVQNNSQVSNYNNSNNNSTNDNKEIASTTNKDKTYLGNVPSNTSETQFVQQHLPFTLMSNNKTNSTARTTQRKQQQQHQVEEEEEQESDALINNKQFEEEDDNENEQSNETNVSKKNNDASVQLKSCLKKTSSVSNLANMNNNNNNKNYIQQICKSAPVSRGNSQAIISSNYNMQQQFNNHNEDDDDEDESSNNNNNKNKGSYSTKRNVVNASMPNQSHQQKQQPNMYSYNAGRAMSYTSGKAQSRKRVLLSDATNEVY